MGGRPVPVRRAAGGESGEEAEEGVRGAAAGAPVHTPRLQRARRAGPQPSRRHGPGPSHAAARSAPLGISA